jgi:malate/lactate dehydrogenase
MEQIIQIKLTPDEQAALNKSAEDIKTNMNKVMV